MELSIYGLTLEMLSVSTLLYKNILEAGPL